MQRNKNAMSLASRANISCLRHERMKRENFAQQYEALMRWRERLLATSMCGRRVMSNIIACGNNALPARRPLMIALSARQNSILFFTYLIRSFAVGTNT